MLVVIGVLVCALILSVTVGYHLYNRNSNVSVGTPAMDLTLREITERVKNEADSTTLADYLDKHTGTAVGPKSATGSGLDAKPTSPAAKN